MSCFTDNLGSSPYITFLNHIATVNHYLNVFRRAPEDERPDLSKSFSKYLVMACWRRMAQRTHHWASIGILCDLHAIPKDVISSATSELASSPPNGNDLALAKAISGLHANLKAVGLIAANAGVVASDFSNLFDVTKKALSLQGPICLYTQSTTVEFHHLLVGTAVTFAQSLRVMRTSETGKSYAQEFAPFIYKYGTLLHAILHSKAFARHLVLLKDWGYLSTPSLAKLERYEHFGRKANLFNPNQLDLMAGAAEEEDELNREAEQFLGMEDPRMGMEDPRVELIRGWMKKFVNHFAAQRILEYHCAKLSDADRSHDKGDSQVEISLLTIGGLGKEATFPNWDTELMGTIEFTLTGRFVCGPISSDSQPAGGPNPNMTVQYIESVLRKLVPIQAARQQDHQVSIFSTIMDLWDSEKKGAKAPKLSARVHCEAFLLTWAIAHGIFKKEVSCFILINQSAV